jgi:hypothetical protein
MRGAKPHSPIFMAWCLIIGVTLPCGDVFFFKFLFIFVDYLTTLSASRLYNIGCDCLSGQDLEGNGLCLIRVLSQNFPEVSDGKCRKPQSGYPMFLSKFFFNSHSGGGGVESKLGPLGTSATE